METRSRTIDAQFAALLDFMERHGDIGKAQSGPHGRILADQLWQKLSDILNVVDGGVKRTPEKWKKVWSDWKSKSKLKAQAIRQHGSGTGTGQKHKKPLTDLEKRVAALLRRSTGISEQGLNRIPKLESESSNEEINFVLIDASDVCETSLPATTLPQISQQDTSNSSTSSESDREPSPQPNRTSDLNSRLQPNNSSTQKPRLAPESARIPRNQARFSSSRRFTPFQRAVKEFASIEMRRLDLEARRIEVDKDRNELLHKIIDIGQTFVEAYINRKI